MQRRALVVDDDVSTCEFIQTVLVANGQEVLTVSNSQEASNHLRREKFSVALIDFAMPAPDGVELTRRARDSGLNQRTPIIVVSDDQTPGAASLAFGAGASFFLYKPIDKTRLVKLINATQGAIEHERRRFRRVPVRSRVQLKLGPQHWLGETIDLSLDGMLVKGAGGFPAGANVQVNLHLAPDIKPIEGAGSVVRVLTENRMGIQLNQLPLAESGRLQEFLLPLIFQASQRELSLHAPQIV
jgi:CheY-like chemotaxis protein